MFRILTLITLIALTPKIWSQTPMTFEQIESKAFYQAIEFFLQNRFDEARRTLRVISKDSRERPADRAMALMHLGWLDWHVGNDLNSSLPKFDQALKLDPNNSRIMVEKARALAHFGYYREAFKVLADAKDHFGPSTQDDVDRARGAHLIADAILIGGISPGMADLGFSLLEPGFRKIAVLPDLGAPLLRLGVAANRPDQIALGWATYYPETVNGSGGKQLNTARRLLSDAVENWHQGVPDEKHRLQIAQALIDSAFPHLAAQLVANLPANVKMKTPALQLIVPYSKYLREHQSITNEYYRKIYSGELRKNDRQTLSKLQLPAIEVFWEEIKKVDPDAGSMTRQKFANKTRSLFHTHFVRSQTHGFTESRLGHIVGEDRQSLTQYGRSGDIDIFMLDGFITERGIIWYADGRGTDGGWATSRSRSYYQVRTSLIGTPLGYWDKLSSPAAIARETKRLDRLAELDEQFNERIRHYPGASERLAWSGVKAIYDRLASSHSDQSLFTAFVAELTRVLIDTSIKAHEGRHALDFIHEAGGRMPSSKLEYRAKLSELVQSEQPKIPLSFFFSPNMGAPTGHGQANLKIMTDIADWMDENVSRIEGFRHDRPALTQVDLLTNEQIREFARSKDPWAKE